MAGIAKPYINAREAKYTFIKDNSHSSVPKTTPPKFLDGEIDQTFPNVLYFNNNTQYVEIELREKSDIWRYTAKSGETNHRNPLIIKKLVNGSYVDVTSTIEQYEIEAGTLKWTKFISKIPSGTYRFYINLTPPTASGSVGYTGIRSDSEWFIEGLEINKTLILHDGEYKKWQTKTSDSYTENLIPVMTSNTAPSGIAEANGILSNNASYESYKSFDGQDSTSWISSTVDIGWISYSFPTDKKIRKYSLEQKTGSVDRMPKKWNFEAWDGSSWVILDSHDNITWELHKTKEFIFENENYYSKYRLNILQAGLTTLQPSVTHFKMFEFLSYGNNNELWETVSSTLPTSEKFLSDGMDSLSPLLDRKLTTLEPQPMTLKSGILQTGEAGKVFSKTLDLKKYLDIRKIKAEVK